MEAGLGRENAAFRESIPCSFFILIVSMLSKLGEVQAWLNEELWINRRLVGFIDPSP
jgi:cell division inhibitor SulA